MPDESNRNWIEAGSEAEIRDQGVVVVQGADRPIAVFAHEGEFFALDNRCPHMGFPLHRGTFKDGILTCHWHQACFDLRSGCTFDPFADDAPAFDTRVREGSVYVCTTPRRPADRNLHLRRLQRGLDQNVGVVIYKSIGSLLALGHDPKDIVRLIAVFAKDRLEGWTMGLTRLSHLPALLAVCGEETRYYALCRAARDVSGEARNATPRYRNEPLDSVKHDGAVLKNWFTHWIVNRRRDAAERVLLSVMDREAKSGELSSLLCGAASERVYASTGHVLTACSDALQLNDYLHDDVLGDLLQLTIPGMADSQGKEEDASWHHPIEIIGPLREIEARLPDLFNRNSTARSVKVVEERLFESILGEDPLACLSALQGALEQGCAPIELARLVAYAAAMRMARFSRNNEPGDWFGPQHTFITANAVYRTVARDPSPDTVRGVFQVAMSVYMDRFLNVPPAPLPSEDKRADAEGQMAPIRDTVLSRLDQRGEEDQLVRAVVAHLRSDDSFSDLVDALAFATMREDLDFHWIQILDAAVEQFRAWNGGREGEIIMAGVARNLAAACPTQRAFHKSASTALKLLRGERIYEDEEPV